MRRPGSFPLAYAVLRRHQVHSLTKQDKGPLLMPSVVISLPNPGWRLMGEREGLQTEAASFLQRTSPKNTPLPRGCGVEPVSGEGPQSAGFLTVEGEVCLSHFFNSHSGKHFHCPITKLLSGPWGLSPSCLFSLIIPQMPRAPAHATSSCCPHAMWHFPRVQPHHAVSSAYINPPVYAAAQAHGVSWDKCPRQGGPACWSLQYQEDERRIHTKR